MFNLNTYKEIIKESNTIGIKELLVDTGIVRVVDEVIQEKLRMGKRRFIITPSRLSTMIYNTDRLRKLEPTDILAVIVEELNNAGVPSKLKEGVIKVDFEMIEVDSVSIDKK